MLRRKIYDWLIDWKNRDHKCLIVKGQRQTGKTYIIERFGLENYEHMISFDLSEDRTVRSAFDGDLDVDTIIRNLMLHHDPEDFVPGSTLIFLDEIQECPSARTALKFFTQDGRYDVIASGSLLGVNIPRENGGAEPLVPTGYEEHYTLRSLDFEEFLWAMKIPQNIIDDVKASASARTPIDRAVLERFDALFREYMVVGGMPEAVMSFLESKNYATPDKVKQDILINLRNDINRYNRGIERDKTLECFLSIPSQLAQSNKKFMYSRIGGGGSRRAADMYRENLLWIGDAGVGNFCYALNSVEMPLRMHEDRSFFKVYMSDTGLLLSMCGGNVTRAVATGDDSINMGAIAENVVCECLVKSGSDIHYYRRNSGELMMELDFVIELGGELCVIEVKSGKHRDAPSLRKVGAHFDVDRRIVFERSNIHVDDEGIEHYPLFAAAFVESLAEEHPDRASS